MDTQVKTAWGSSSKCLCTQGCKPGKEQSNDLTYQRLEDQNSFWLKARSKIVRILEERRETHKNSWKNKRAEVKEIYNKGQKLEQTITEKSGNGLSHRKGFMFFAAKNGRQDLRLERMHSSQAANALPGTGKSTRLWGELSEMKMGEQLCWGSMW